MNKNFKNVLSFEVKAIYGRGPVYAGQVLGTVRASRPYEVLTVSKLDLIKEAK